MSRHEFLRSIHRTFKPRTYLEIGVNDGGSLTFAHCRSIAIDPDFAVTKPITCDLALYRQTSDDFFDRRNPTAHFGRAPIDLAFIDGMHLFEYTPADFINVERHAGPASVIILDDMLPRSVVEAARERTASQWAGDVFKVAAVLAKYRPDLDLRLVDTHPTGVMVVFGADPTSRVLRDNLDEILAAHVYPDPQEVPPSILSRSDAVDPDALLRSRTWATLIKRRDAASKRSTVGRLRTRILKRAKASALLSRLR